MNIWRFATKAGLGRAAAERAAELMRGAIAARGSARIIAATGASQFEFLSELVRQPAVDWRRVEMFHLDEYVGLPATHPASFRKYLLERLIRPAGIERYHLLDGDAPDPAAVAREIGRRLNDAPVDVAFVGIGENGHLAFNDPPADFDTEEPYLIVTLDDACRRQQVGEGWYRSLDEVPRQAISMSIRQILKSRTILCIVPDLRKADAVAKCLEGPISPMAPASALRLHPDVELFLDRDSASLLRTTPIVDR
ncbi:MAG: glucosamine-6-phosphate deaminase [Kiritimatiellae bacterium]|nr:glucosamine-6-phosphate deaminase [Kiritimatiellia bacterium]